MRKTKRRLLVSMGAIMAALLFVNAPASAWSGSKSAPYGGGQIGYATLEGYIGNFEVYRNSLSGNPPDGTIQFHLGADTGPPTGAVWVDGHAGLDGGLFFTAPYTGSYLIDYYFTIVSGNAQMQTFPTPWPMNAATVELMLQFGGNLKDQNGWWALHADQMTGVFGALIGNPLSWYQDLSGRQYKVEFSTPTINAGMKLYLYAYEYGYIKLNWPFSGLYALGLFDMNAKLTSATAYIYSGGGGGCVQKDTPILTPSGNVPVQKLKAGDSVLEYDISAGQLVTASVVSTTLTKVTNMISMNDGALVVTPYDQPLYMQNSTFTGWLRNPGELAVGDYIFNAQTGSWTLVTKLEGISGSFQVYDVVTTGLNNYVANGFLLDMK